MIGLMIKIMMLVINTTAIGIIIYLSTIEYKYLRSVFIYTIAKSTIPMITASLFGMALGGGSINMGQAIIIGILITGAISFILGLCIIKIMEVISDRFSQNFRMSSFLVVFSVLEIGATMLFNMVLASIFTGV